MMYQWVSEDETERTASLNALACIQEGEGEGDNDFGVK